MTDAKSLDFDQATFEISLTNVETSGRTFDDVVVEGIASGIPPEVLTRMKELWGKTQELGTEVIYIGKIIVIKIIDFLKANPKLTASLAIGGAVHLLSNSIPWIGPWLAPLLGCVTSLGVLVSSTSLEEAIAIAKISSSCLSMFLILLLIAGASPSKGFGRKTGS